MTRLPRLAVLATCVAAVLTGAPYAAAEQVCQSVRVDLIQDWVYCANVVRNPDGSVTVWVDCDMGDNKCRDATWVTLP